MTTQLSNMKKVSKAIGSFDNKIIAKELSKVISKFNLKGKVIDYGCGQMPYKEFFENSEVIGADIPNPTMPTKATVMIEDYKTPLPDKSFDGAVCTEVIEHVEAPDKVLIELRRLLKPNGFLILTAPFMIPEHDERDYWRFTLKGLKLLAAKNGFEAIHEKKLTKNFHSAGHLTGNAINVSLMKPGKKHRYLGAIIALPLYFIIRALMAVMNKPSSVNTGPMTNLVVCRKR